MSKYHPRRKRRLPLLIRRLPWILLGFVVCVGVVYFVPAFAGVISPMHYGSSATSEIITDAEVVPKTETIDLLKYEKRVFDLINETRGDNGLQPLRWAMQYYELAESHSEYMARTGEFEHSKNNVYENIYMCEGCVLVDIPQATIKSWLNSPEHKANLLQRSTNSCGIGIVQRDNITYVTFVTS